MSFCDSSCRRASSHANYVCSSCLASARCRGYAFSRLGCRLPHLLRYLKIHCANDAARPPGCALVRGPAQRVQPRARSLPCPCMQVWLLVHVQIQTLLSHLAPRRSPPRSASRSPLPLPLPLGCYLPHGPSPPPNRAEGVGPCTNSPKSLHSPCSTRGIPAQRGVPCRKHTHQGLAHQSRPWAWPRPQSRPRHYQQRSRLSLWALLRWALSPIRPARG
mmetsp:Transcript_28840/g.67044  ORF Transcript_28840/g.67044 Transcript_28840/m.67044 type:complete len:218 (-) Transcript_28840:975-1628(-)